ncbi:MAG: hypothetical protein HY530_04250 [Chloroflexi bacterium]|nr:hypothetical protein [Chloroflexota bacterium]
MNWFERYGIPGFYFVGLMAGWTYAFSPHTNNILDNPGLIAAFIAVSLPIGYIISIVSQAVYLSWRRCLWNCRHLRGWLGYHGAAMDMAGITSIGFPGAMPPDNRDERLNEANTLLLTALSKRTSVRTQEYVRNWIARRQDVCAMNQSVILATLLAPILAFVICKLQPGSPRADVVIFLSSVSAAVILAMIFGIQVLRKQVIEVIAGIYRAIGDARPDQPSPPR